MIEVDNIPITYMKQVIKYSLRRSHTAVNITKANSDKVDSMALHL